MPTGTHSRKTRNRKEKRKAKRKEKRTLGKIERKTVRSRTGKARRSSLQRNGNGRMRYRKQKKRLRRWKNERTNLPPLWKQWAVTSES